MNVTHKLWLPFGVGAGVHCPACSHISASHTVLEMPSAVLLLLQPCVCCAVLCCAMSCCAADYGVVCCWGLTVKQEQDILTNLAKKAQQQPLPTREVKQSTQNRIQLSSRPTAAAPGQIASCSFKHHAL